MFQSIFYWAAALLCISAHAWAELPTDCNDVDPDDVALMTVCRVYRQNESCQLLDRSDLPQGEKAICEAFRDRQCESLRSISKDDYQTCRVYLTNESCSFLDDSTRRLVCQAHREGLCDRYDGKERKDCLRKYTRRILVIHKTKYSQLYFHIRKLEPLLKHEL